MFWLARNMERSENLARILDVNETFSRDARGSQNWLSIVQLHAGAEGFFKKHQAATANAVINYYLLDTENSSSIAYCLKAARDNARTLRPLLSTELWTQVNMFHAWIKTLTPADIGRADLSRLCSKIKEGCQTHTGILEGTLYRDEGWYFYQLGKLIERADQATRLLDIKYHMLLPSAAEVGSPLDVSQWNALLRSAAGYHAYRRVQPRGMSPASVAGFLIFNNAFPRSVAVSIATIDEIVVRLRQRYGLRAGNQTLEILDGLRGTLANRSIDMVLGGGLHEFLDWIQLQLIAITDDLSKSFFGHSPTPQVQAQVA
jgi:uncharacterized alpha-E superfamily protein